MTGIPSGQDCDWQLRLILYETATWTVKGAPGGVQYDTASLHAALLKTMEIAAFGGKVIALIRSQPTEIVLFSDQIWELIAMLPEYEISDASDYALKA